MSFNIFVSGSRGKGRKSFHYSKDDCVDLSDFEPPALVSMIPSSPDLKGVVDKAIEQVIGTPESNVTTGVIQGYSKLAEIQLAGAVGTCIARLTMRDMGGQINVYCVQEGLIWGNTNSFASYRLYSGGEPGKDFMRKIGPCLVKTEFNNIGVLRQLILALTKYEDELPGSAEPFLNISLSQ